jgi:hypothetical protein
MCPESKNQTWIVMAQVMRALSVNVSCLLYVKGNICIVYCGVINSFSQFNVVIKDEHKSWKSHYLWFVVSHMSFKCQKNVWCKFTGRLCWSVWWKCHERREYIHMRAHIHTHTCMTYIYKSIQAYIHPCIHHTGMHTYIPWIHKCVTKTVGCRTSHKFTNVRGFYSIKFKHLTKQYYRASLRIKDSST